MSLEQATLVGMVIGAIFLYFMVNIWRKSRALEKSMGQEPGSKLLNAINKLIAAIWISTLISEVRMVSFLVAPDAAEIRVTLLVMSNLLVVGTLVWVFLRVRAGFS